MWRGWSEAPVWQQRGTKPIQLHFLSFWAERRIQISARCSRLPGSFASLRMTDVVCFRLGAKSAPMPGPLTILIDNGSLEPAATLALRGLAAKLGEHIGERIEPVSLLHSTGVPVEKLNGAGAEILEPALGRRLDAGVKP